MEVLKFMHTCIAVTDLDKAVDFYCNCLGMKSVFETDNNEADGILLGLGREQIHIRARHVIAPNADPMQATELNLCEFVDPKTIEEGGAQSVMNHVGITRLALMVNDLEEALEKIRGFEGAEIACEPRDLQIIEPDATYVVTWASVKDPFGVFICLAQPPRPEA